MLRLSLRTLFSLTPSRSLSPYSIFLTPSRSLPPYSILIAQCSTSSPPHFTHPHSHSVPDSRNVRVSVWWDLDNCNVPSSVNPLTVIPAITAALKSSGIKGPIKMITAFGNSNDLSDTTRWGLTYSSIDLIGARDDDAPAPLEMVLKNWTFDNPPPGHLLFIGAFGGFSQLSQLLPLLSLKGYNILLALKEPVPADLPDDLRDTVTIIWNWNTMVRGGKTVRYLNQPPHGYSYVHYEGPLEDPSTEIAPGDQPVEELQHELFSQASFWSKLQTFLNTKVGNFIISESRTRENLVFCLQNYGPDELKSVTKSDVILLVDRLICKENWLQQTPYSVLPFKLTDSGKIKSSDDAQASSGQKL